MVARRALVFCLFTALAPWPALARQQAHAPAVERVFRLSGSLGAPRGGSTVTLVFAVYDVATGGTPLWHEAQSVVLDGEGQYVAFVGAAATEGLPAAVFSTGAPRWLAVEGADGAALQPRVLLTSVPYAVHAASAGDAQTLAGRPVSHFQLTRAGRTADAAVRAEAAAEVDAPTVNAGTANYVGKFQNTVDLVNSALYDASGRIGVGTTTPLDFLHVRFSDAAGGMTGFAVQNTSSSANAYSGMLFYDHTGALGQFQGFNNTTKQYRINNIASGGSINFMLASTSRLFIGAAGIGLGTTSPGSPLHVTGAIRTDAQFNLGASRVLAAPGTGNLVVGVAAGAASITGTQNTFVGAQAGAATTTGSTNTFLGEQAGQANVSGGGNTFLGESAGLVATASNNTFVGQRAGRAVTSATGNTFLGQNAGATAATAADNTFLGQNAGAAATGAQNTFVGQDAGAGTSSGTNNTLVGQAAGFSNGTGSFNTFLGDQTGTSNTTGSSNTLIGQLANVSFGNLTNAAAIGARATVAQSNTIVLGAINGLNGATANTLVGIGTTIPADPLHVVGDIRIGTGTTGCVKDTDGTVIAGTCSSDLRFKTDVQPFGRLLDRVARLRPVSFYWKQAAFPGRHFGAAQSFGLIAQEVEQVLPELVVEDAEGYRAVNYSRLPLVTLQAVTELAQENETLRRDNESLRAAQDALRARLEALEQAVAAATRTPPR